MSEQDQRIIDALARLGLVGYAVGAPDTQPAPAQDTSQSLSGTLPGLTELAERPAVDLLHPAITRVGFEVGWLPGNTRVLELFHPEGTPTILPEPGPGRIVTDDDGVTRVDLSGATEVVALSSKGTQGLYLSVSSTGALTFWPIERDADLPPPSPHDPPLSAWAAALRSGDPPRDPWIADEIDKLSKGSRDGALTAVGLLARLCAPDPDPSARAARIQAMLMGNLPDEPWVAWARGLDEEATAEVARIADDATRMFTSDLETASVGYDVDPYLLGALALGRDDLECLRSVILDEDLRHALDIMLEACDAIAADMLEELPESVWFDAGERLARVATLQPEAWWIKRALRS